MLVDTHCHLTFETFDPDREAVLERARQNGVVRLVNPGLDIPSSQAAVVLAGTHPEVFAAVGVHPNEAYAWGAGSEEQLKDLAKHPKVCAIGEIGLDYYWERAPHELQREVFRAQLSLAAQLGLPVVVHTRDKSSADRQASLDVLEILGEWQDELSASGSPIAGGPGVLHSFSGDEEIAKRALAMNFYIGITGPLTYKSSHGLQQIVSDAPLGQIVIETDAPFLPPQPHRGERNEPSYVQYVCEKIAHLRRLPEETVAQMTTNNAERLFHWQVMN